MQLHALDHYTVKTTDVEATARFYEYVFGMERGPMPELDFSTLWLYAGNKPVLHIVERDEVTETDGGLIDHVAFRATDYSGIKAKLDARDIEFPEQCLPQIGLHQVFAKCDDGTWVELIFDPKEVTG